MVTRTSGNEVPGAERGRGQLQGGIIHTLVGHSRNGDEVGYREAPRQKNQITVDTEPRKTFHVPLADGPIKRTVKFSQLKCFFLYLSF